MREEENPKFQIPNHKQIPNSNDQNKPSEIIQVEVKVKVEIKVPSPQAFKIKPEGRLIVWDLLFGICNFP
ncbi:MAG: hypothetical protein GTO45_22975 [Candidatus Aminicenantes bacterium]|nr:hypothetical protein [Candidatus Aminicenantes bacterium]NIM81628.1 hypothetical protein [Candidatus Aminicenantes bacterium]NIN20998.1 hypothetical protein [Candidatus Aminicenantes bacterium]NIN44819.1 hypothetical protein [Candidatus Aminicenantes bacterium]NIN87627.1 hypothetical protein [Candidatus Aminicenantes bacterium]